ncbi:MAG: hypothetical protein ACODAE_06465 [Gemmatimonadota bacterium]
MLRRVVLALAVLGPVALACDGDPAGPAAGVEGTYELVALNGEPPPFDHELGCCIYTAGGLILESGEYEASVSGQNKNDQMVFTVTERGTYDVVDGGAIVVEPSETGSRLALHDLLVAGDTITLFLGGDGPGADDQFHARYER